MRGWSWMAAVAVLGTLAPGPARADARDDLLAYVLRSAEQDFEAVRHEAALSGSAPLAGLEPDRKADRKAATQARKRSRARSDAKARPATKPATAVDVKPATLGRPSRGAPGSPG